MRKHFISLCRKLLALLGVGAALNSCDIFNFGACMYGCPSADYKITGSVKDEMGNPIKGIAISQYQPAGPNDDGSVIYDGWEGEAFATTAEDGTFDIFQNMFPMTGMQLMFRDVDGTENGGDFEDQSVSVEFRQVEKSKDSWYEGVFEAKKPVDVVMKLKQIPVQADPEDGSEGSQEASEGEKAE